MAEWKKKEEEMRYDIFELSFNQMLKKNIYFIQEKIFIYYCEIQTDHTFIPKKKIKHKI